MKHAFYVGITAVLSCVMLFSAASGENKSLAITRGISFSTVDINRGTKAYLVKMKKGAGDLVVRSADAPAAGQAATGAFFVGDFARRFRLEVAISGGYMISYSPPKALGYVKVGNNVLSKPNTSWLGSAEFCAKGAVFKIGKYKNEDTKNYEDCLQAGPLFVDNGENRYVASVKISGGEQQLVRSLQSQAFICDDQSGDLWVGVTDDIRLDKFANFAVETLKCRNAMRLTGYSTAAMQVGNETYGPGELPLNSVVAIRARK